MNLLSSLAAPIVALALIAVGYRSMSVSASAVGPVKAMVRSLAVEWADARFQLFSTPVPHRDWVFPLMSAILGFVYVLLGLAVARRRNAQT